MERQRARRVSEQIRKEVSAILRDQVKDPRLGFATITGVEVSNDLSDAKIFFSVYGKEGDRESTREALESARGFIRKEVGERIQLRHVPEIRFLYDSSLEHAAHINSLIEKIHKGETGEE